jgi:hypothetical protein
MSLRVSKVMIWSVELEDRPGAAADKLQTLAQAKTDLQFVLARRQAGQFGKGVLFVSPIRGSKQEEAASRAGFAVDMDLVAVRVDGDNKPGLGNRMMQAIGQAGINLRGFSALVTGKKFAAFIAFDNTTDADRGLAALRKIK